jgi:ribosomal protein L11 methyltransferase
LAEYPALDISCDNLDSPLGDRLYALLDDFEPLGIQAVDGGVRVFFRSASMRAKALRAVVRGEGLTATARDVSDEDWARRSQENLRAVEAGGLIIAPPWDVPIGGKSEVRGRRSGEDGGRGAEGGGVGRCADAPVIIIEPSTGFGTGHHATTRLCLRMMQQLDLRGARVLDVGTGSGVLALAAWKLGAGDVVGIDNDPDALDNALANVKRNGAGPSIDLIHDDLSALRIQRADVVMANLSGAALVRFADDLRSLLVPGGYLIVSGFAPDDCEIIRRTFASLAVIAEQTEGEWASLLLRGE